MPEEYRKLFTCLKADITNDRDVNKIIKKTSGLRPNKLLLVNNAGFGISGSFEKINIVDAGRVIDTNLLGALKLTQGLLRIRNKKAQNDIVFVTSLAGKIGFPGLAIYSASKFALEGLAETLRLEYKDKNVDIFVLRPGVTDTNFFNTAGMAKFYNSVKGTKAIHTSESVAKLLIKGLERRKPIIVAGGDKYFLKLLPLIPFNKRFGFLDITNKL